MGNDASSKIVNIGTVWIKMFDGIIKNFKDIGTSKFEEESYFIEYSWF